MAIEILTYKLKEEGFGYRIIGREDDRTNLLSKSRTSFSSEESARRGAHFDYLCELEREHGCMIRSGRWPIS